MTDNETLLEVMRLLDEGLTHALARDGHHKSAEGHVSVSYANSFDRLAGEDPLKIQDVDIYSYVLGPSRSHHFTSLKEALDAVRQWHADEMATEA